MDYLNFENALSRLKEGEKIARVGWNGKDMFLYYVPPGAYEPCTEIAKSIADPQSGLVPYGGYIALKTAQDNVVPWVPSQTDILERDWMVV